MKSFIKAFTVLAFIGLATSSFAQTKEGLDKKQDYINTEISKMDRAVTLTAEQKPVVTELANQYMNQLEEYKKDEKTFADNKKILDATFNNKLKEVLTADQWAKYEAKRKEEMRKK